MRPKVIFTSLIKMQEESEDPYVLNLDLLFIIIVKLKLRNGSVTNSIDFWPPSLQLGAH